MTALACFADACGRRKPPAGGLRIKVTATPWTPRKGSEMRLDAVLGPRAQGSAANAHLSVAGASVAFTALAVVRRATRLNRLACSRQRTETFH